MTIGSILAPTKKLASTTELSQFDWSNSTCKRVNSAMTMTLAELKQNLL